MTQAVPQTKPLDGALCIVENFMAVIAGAVLAVVMLLVSADAVLRHIFLAPIPWQFTLTESYLMVAGIAMGLPWGYRTGGRIRINLLLSFVPAGRRRLMLRVGNLLVAPYIAVLCWKSAEKTWDAFANSEYMMGIIDWPVGWSWIWVPLALAVLTIRLVFDAFGDVDHADSAEH
ncbi:TRAP transporter small permease [Puniceibacterium sp. IMCC21224]|uniref:TRAP transporter small permease n=1 Tax=Puniceibacterium sp. IMCC21224 TaxID=1618204 RepID=UPI00064DA0EF|nr:TRAP transporter small permease [Puniceibacterium sp. IMCC21224]KMK65919.1 TRAP-type C4-dicarboxylate transport system, small permease component [Puniceibacterium sp. IMCC21224]